MPPPALTRSGLAGLIDLVLLRPDACDEDFDRLCRDASQFGFCAVCVNSGRVSFVARRLRGTGVRVSSAIGFPLGAMTSRSKAFEARDAVSGGAEELDMVINVGALKSRDYRCVEEDIRAVRRSTRAGTVLKVTIETALLSPEERVVACELSRKAGADFVATSTGFSRGTATVEDMVLMRRIVGNELGVKACGGIRDASRALALVDAGADRIGAVAGVVIVTG